MRSPLKYYGGKFYQAKWIKKHFPPHQMYIEPFCGSAAVFFAKAQRPVYATRGYTEVLNDIDSRISKFFTALKDRPEELIQEAWIVPYAEYIHDKPEIYSDEIQVLILTRFNFGAHTGRRSGFAYNKCASDTQPLAQRWKNIIPLLWKATNRLKDAIIMNRSYEEIIELFDGKEALFYCDPPYIVKSGKYRYDFEEEDHRKLADILSGIEGKVLISYYDHPLLDELYPENKWKRTKKTFNVYADKMSMSKTRRKTHEMLLKNFG